MIQGAKATIPPESDTNLARRTIASITIQPKDLRPFVLRRWSATALPDIRTLDEAPLGKFYWRARSKEKLVAKAAKKLRRKGLSFGIDSPVIVVNDLPGDVRVWIPA